MRAPGVFDSLAFCPVDLTGTQPSRYPNDPQRCVYDLRYWPNHHHEQLIQSLRGHMFPADLASGVRGMVYEASLNTLALADRLCTADRIVANSRHSAQYLSRVDNRPVAEVVYPGQSRSRK